MGESDGTLYWTHDRHLVDCTDAEVALPCENPSLDFPELML